MENSFSNLVLNDTLDNDPAIMTFKKLPNLPPSYLPSPSTADFDYRYSDSKTSIPPVNIPPGLLNSSVWGAPDITPVSQKSKDPWMTETSDVFSERRDSSSNPIAKPIRLEDLEASFSESPNQSITRANESASSIGRPGARDSPREERHKSSGWNPLTGVGAGLYQGIVPRSNDDQEVNRNRPYYPEQWTSSPPMKQMTLEELENQIFEDTRSLPAPNLGPTSPIVKEMPKSNHGALTLEELERAMLEGPPENSQSSAVSGEPVSSPKLVQPLLQQRAPPGLPPGIVRPPLRQTGPPQPTNLQHSALSMDALSMNAQMHPMMRMVATPQGPRMIGRPIVHPHLVPPHLQQQFLLLQHAPYRPVPRHMPPHPLLQQNRAQYQPRPYYRPQVPGYFNRDDERNYDEYAGLMTQREKDWLIKIQLLQLEGSVTDPYKEDYYSVSYNSKKLERTAKANNDNSDGSAPTLVVPDRRGLDDRNGKEAHDDGRVKYVPLQFAGSLGKIQVSDLSRPRKLLDFLKMNESSAPSENEPATPSRSELAKLKKLLLDIEQLYLILLDIDYEDKRMAALPAAARQVHLVKREQLCKKLFDRLVDEEGKLDENIGSIRKGRSLILRAIVMFGDLRHKACIIPQVIERRYHLAGTDADRKMYGLDGTRILVDAIRQIKAQDESLLAPFEDVSNALLES